MVMAAPNRSRIKAKVLQTEPSARFADKWHLELEILESEDLEGPNFARVGETAQGVAFEQGGAIAAGDVISAEAEFVGGPRGGQFRLFEVAALRVGDTAFGVESTD